MKAQVTNFHYLSPEEIEHPMLAICNIFQPNHPELCRQRLRLLFKLASTRHSFPKVKHQYLYEVTAIHLQIMKFLEIAQLLLDQNKDLSIKEGHAFFQTESEDIIDIPVDKRLQDPVMKHCRLLNDQEINNVKKVFKRIFKCMPLEKWKIELDRLLNYSLFEEGVLGNSPILFSTYDLLEKLIEAMYVLDQIETRCTQTTADIFQNETTGNDTTSDLVNDENFDICLSKQLENEIVDFFETCNPKVLSINLRKVLFGYLSFTMTNLSTVFDEDQEAHYQIERLFCLLDKADDEVSTWPTRIERNYYSTGIFDSVVH